MEDTFSQVTAATSGPLAGYYLWSTAANWSLGAPPTDGDSVVVSDSSLGMDDLAALTLATLTLSDFGYVSVGGSSLDVTSVIATYGGLTADAFDAGTPVTVTVGSISGTGANSSFEAVGAGAVFVDQSATDPGDTYLVSRGGITELSATPSGNSILVYPSQGTFALRNPGAANAVLLNGVAPGDVLELPGSSVGGVSFGSHSLSITTNDGSYTFSDVNYQGEPITGYSAAFDTATGLEAVTFLRLNTFSQVSPATSGPLAGDYLWSDAANWSLGAPPADGDSVSTAVKGYDDLYVVSLTSLLLGDGGIVDVTGASLDATSVAATAGTGLLADALDAGTPVTVTVGTITGTGGDYGADGTGGIFVDQSAVDPGDETYFAGSGGFTELSATPASGSSLEYGGAASTFALQNPATTNAVALMNVAPGEVLELPGSSASIAGFGPDSLSVTTNDGSYVFSNVTYVDAPPTGDSAAFDSATGLEAITFLGPDTFLLVSPATSGPLDGFFLWSNAANWSLGAPPVDGGSAAAADGIDDLATLTLVSLTLGGGGVVDVTGASLDVTAVDGLAGAGLVADASLTGAPVTVTVGTIAGTGGSYGAIGAGAVFVDQSAADPEETYVAYNGGFTELSATPNSISALEYAGAGSTFALQNPGAINGFALNNMAQSDVLELPGSSVSNVSFGSGSLNVTTNDGSYAFSNVTYGAGPLIGYRAAFDSTTGLEAITFLGTDTFSLVAPATSGPLTGDYVWSTAANWSLGAPPADGDSVATGEVGQDDLAPLSLASLILTNHSEVFVAGTSLDVTSVVATGSTELTADESLVGTPAMVTVGTITGTGGDYGAIGAGATFVDLSPADPGEIYHAESGGLTELSATPNSGSALKYAGAGSTFALLNPGATNAFELNNVAPTDVLELPGSSVSDVSFGPGSLSITTNDGSYAFSNVTYGAGPLIGYRAAFDSTTGLEAITFLGTDTFSLVAPATSGPLTGDYVWSTAANWSLGAPPADGDSVATGEVGQDDLAPLSLASLILTNHSEVFVAGTSLDVTSVVATGSTELTADESLVGTPAMVTVGTITGTGGDYGAIGAGATFVDLSPADPGEIYHAESGGLTELSATPNSGSALGFFGTASTFALLNPGATNAIAIDNVVPGDVLELPGSSVSDASFGPDSLSVTTNDGSYDFSDVLYGAGQLGGYSAAFDPTTGLEAITFLPLDTFSQTTAAASGPLAGNFLWSNATNWTQGAPIDGTNVSTTNRSIDDLTALSLASLALSDSASVFVTGASLDVAAAAGATGTSLVAEAAYLGTPVTVTVGTVTGTGGSYGATGAGAVFVDQSAVDPGETYTAQTGGFIELSATPSGSSSLEYSGVGSTFALLSPGAANAFALLNVAPTDVLELPGSSVSTVSFGPGSLAITTNDGNYTFSDVTDGSGPLTGYSAAFDSTTGLEAITFTGPDTFSLVSPATSGPLAGDYLWSDAANWTNGVPLDGASAGTASEGDDDISALTLANLTVSASVSIAVTGASLDVTSFAGAAGSFLEADASLAGTPVTVTVGTITGSGGNYGASGLGAVFQDQSAVDPGANYLADNGGLTELSAAPSNSSTLNYGATNTLPFGATNTFALRDPGAANAFALNFVAGRDVLELPGTSVSNVSPGPDGLSITTNDGSYAFSNVSYTDGPVIGYSAAFDSATGLEAVTFTAPDIFTRTTEVGGEFRWSVGTNWSRPPSPVDGDSVSAPLEGGVDDLPALSLTSLSLGDGASLYVTGASLEVNYVADAAATQLVADAHDAGAPVTVTVDTIAGTGGKYGANGAGAVFVDQSAVDPGETYIAQSGGLTELSAAPSNGSSLGYSGTASTFALRNPGATNAVALTNVAFGDVLELPGSSVSTVNFGTGSLSITTNTGGYAFSNVNYAGAPATSYSAAFDPATGLEAITMLCFCEGSVIRTPSGDVLVQDLAIGDKVVTWSGEHRPITWIGIGRVLATAGHRTAATPVLVCEGAFADNVPHADLRVTKGHSFFIDDALIPVEFLINHRSIRWDDGAREVSLYHIELSSHDILIANGAPAESYRDDGNRWLFQNANSTWDLTPRPPFAPVLTGGVLVDRIWRRLLDRSGPRPGRALTDDAELHLRVDGLRLDHIRRDGSAYTFCLPASARHDDVRIVSHAAAPDQLGLARDPRVLGVALRNVIVLAGARNRIFAAADDRLVDGFHGHEPELEIRWTNGDAALPAAFFDGFDGRIDLVIQVEGTARYLATAACPAIAA